LSPASKAIAARAYLKRARSIFIGTVRICVGQISARCESCGGEEFQPSPGGSSPPLELVCFGCGLRATRRALLVQVAEETVRRAQAFLEASRSQRRQPPR
jgi:hypothetical protein